MSSQEGARWLMWLNTVCRFAEPMKWLALLFCWMPATRRFATDTLGLRRAAPARARHSEETHPRHVAAKEHIACFAAH